MQTCSDGSLLERLGGHDKAVEQVRDFYARKYALPPTDRAVSTEQDQALRTKHADCPIRPITDEEIRVALEGVKPSTATGLDTVCYTAIKAYHGSDTSGKLASFFNSILKEDQPVPQDWLTGKVCLLPKVPLPSRVQDLRPISLTPCSGKIFSKILVKRLREIFPPYGAGQHANRPGTQVLEAVAAQSTMKLYRKATGQQTLVCKLDISQAFDTLSHQALWRFFLETPSCKEALALWNMCQHTRVLLQLGSKAWEQQLGRGVLQGTSFSADIFSRVLDFFLKELFQGWRRNEHAVFQHYRLPHALLFADDILLFATATDEMQYKLRGLHKRWGCISTLRSARF